MRWNGGSVSVSYTHLLLSDDQQLPSPFSLPGMEQVARRLARAAANKEKVFIFGDYDCDGICSTLIMTRFLERCGAEVKPFLPSRQDDGYGITSHHVRRAVDEGFDLIVTVDNGISAVSYTHLDVYKRQLLCCARPVDRSSQLRSQYYR